MDKKKNSVSPIRKDYDLGIVAWWSDGVAAFAVFLIYRFFSIAIKQFTRQDWTGDANEVIFSIRDL
jgi:hypothetical protein